jgi:replicative DNA helicase
LTLGLKPADLLVLAGRPGMGKSVGGFGIAAFDALRGGRTAVFSLEMSAAQMVEREISALGDIPYEWLRNPEKGFKDEHGQFVSDTYWSRASLAASDLIKSGMLVDDTPALTIQQIAARAKRAHLQAPLTMVVIDHLHIVKIKGGDNVVNQLGDVSRGAKALGKELRCPVVLLAQLNRGNTARADKRPTMADLRGSGEIEQDADYILLLHREDYYDENSYARGLVEMIVGKARHAKARVLYLFNRLDKMRFEDCEGELPKKPEPEKKIVARSSWESRKPKQDFPR